MASRGTRVTGPWKPVSSDYDAKDEIVEVRQTLKIYFPGEIKAEDLVDRIWEELESQPDAEPIYVEARWKGVEVFPEPAVIFDVTYQYVSRGLIVELIILAVIGCILVWLGIQLVDRINETIRVMPEEMRRAVPVLAGAGLVLLIILALLLWRREKSEG